MKIYSLVYKYQAEESDSDMRDYTFLITMLEDCLEDAMYHAEKEIKKKKGYIKGSAKLLLKSIMSVSDILDKIKVSLPELVKNAKERERLAKVAEALND